MAYIEVIDHQNAEGELKEIYDNLVKSRGQLAEVHKIQSLNPKTIVNHMDLYMSIMFGKSPIRRYQREMIAVIVSKANQCEYCQLHHGEALNHFWKDAQKVNSLRDDFTKVELNEKDLALCEYAWNHTLNPGKGNKETQAQKLKDTGLNDRAVLDVNLVVAYFNFVNRLVLGLGVTLEKNEGKGFKYD